VGAGRKRAGRHAPAFVRHAVSTCDDDPDEPSTVFPVGMWDTVAFKQERGNGDLATGGVAVVSHSGDTLRVRGVGAVDVRPEYVVEVTERYDRRDKN
jgi:hypothetical protein